jgi:lipid II isoglutaminyl synthase (glutamine-hydrolysing)
MRLLVLVVVYLAKILGGLSRLFKLGRGTSISGWIVEKQLPFLLKYFVGRYNQVIYISGTNGKTTTRSLVVQALRNSGHTVVTNSGGANIYRGIAASLLNDLTLLGSTKSTLAVLEVEEATLPVLANYLPATVLVLTNLARDQLDVYGELDITQAYFTSSLSKMPDAILILNADDPKLLEMKVVASIGVYLKDSTIQYETSTTSLATIQTPLVISENNLGLAVEYNNERYDFVPQLTGQYNSINYALAAAALTRCGLSFAQITKSFNSSLPVFGRSEVITTDKAHHTLLLVKNPLGLGSVFTSYSNKPVTRVIIGINDNIADGRDVSWLWDVDFESFFKDRVVEEIVVTGTRAADIGLRIYQTLRFVKQDTKVVITYTIPDIADVLLTTTEDYLVLGTYTAMMQLRSILEKPLSLPAIDSSNF